MLACAAFLTDWWPTVSLPLTLGDRCHSSAAIAASIVATIVVGLAVCAAFLLSGRDLCSCAQNLQTNRSQSSANEPETVNEPYRSATFELA